MTVILELKYTVQHMQRDIANMCSTQVLVHRISTVLAFQRGVHGTSIKQIKAETADM